MDVRVEAGIASAHAEVVEVIVLIISILPTPVVLARTVVPASTRIPSIGNTSLSAVPAPTSYLGGTLAHAA